MIIDEGDKSVMLGRLTEQLAARDQRIEELEAELAAEKAKHIEIGQARYKTVQALEADNTRLREALDKISNKAKCVCMLEVGRGVGDCETCKIADEALAPQAAKDEE